MEQLICIVDFVMIFQLQNTFFNYWRSYKAPVKGCYDSSGSEVHFMLRD